mmetsp:Transcript_48606/g.114069  ORF Transcript_48606/g.114069 Transcript_48606/m.114069 type:complete len:87 (+) Transcript_48606:1858-2118(+)
MRHALPLYSAAAARAANGLVAQPLEFYSARGCMRWFLLQHTARLSFGLIFGTVKQPHQRQTGFLPKTRFTGRARVHATRVRAKCSR